MSALAPAAESRPSILSSKCAVVLAALSFIIYAFAVLTLPQVHNSPFCCESSGVAAAVSNIKYGAPLGSFYSGVLDYYDSRSREPLSRVLEDSTNISIGLPAIPPGKLLGATRDGNGVGYPLFVTAAFRLFGVHTWALQAGTLLLMALSASVFLWQFRDDASATVVTLCFSALTVMLFLATTWDPIINSQVTVGGVRYFSLLAALPFFHILRTFLDRESPETGVLKQDLLRLAVQSQILLLVVLTRGTAISLGVGVALGCIVLAWRRRRSGCLLRALLHKLAVMAVASLTSLILIASVVSPDYFVEGRFGPTIWERVISGMGSNPNWPFPGLNDMFDCKQHVPAGIVRGGTDNNAHCIWSDFATKNQISGVAVSDQINSSLYEDALRRAFLTIAARYPAEVVETFVYYKPIKIFQSLTASLRFNFHGEQSLARFPGGPAVVSYDPGAICLFAGALGVLLLQLFIVVPQAPAQMAGLTIYAILCTLPSYLVAFSAPHTTADLLLYCLLCAGLAFSAAVIWARSHLRLWPRLQPVLSKAE